MKNSVAKSTWENCAGGICAPIGFTAAAASVGLKQTGLDLAIIVSDRPASAAACFTQNQCVAAPVALSRRYLKKSRGRVQAILINSGCANAATGPRGMQDARRTVAALGRTLGLPAASILVCSTGVIGLPLDAEKIVGALPRCVAGLSPKQGERAAEAISTTDTVLKIESISLQNSEMSVRIGGIAKGAGMIHPNMATMLAFITTDAVISPAQLQNHLSWCVERSFNCITVDGDTSTNDSVMVLANGASGVEVSHWAEIGKARLGEGEKGRGGDEETRRRGERGAKGHGDGRPGRPGEAHRMTASSRSPLSLSPPLYIPPSLFRAGLLEVCRRLARKIAWDGEGATHHLEIGVCGARSFEQARNVGRAIGRSNLVKTAIYGHDPNWGRVLSAIGASGEAIISSRVRIAVNRRMVAENGVLKNLPDSLFHSTWKRKRIQIAVDLSLGDHSASCWSCDLSHEYIDINGSYRT